VLFVIDVAEIVQDADVDLVLYFRALFLRLQVIAYKYLLDKVESKLVEVLLRSSNV